MAKKLGKDVLDILNDIESQIPNISASVKADPEGFEQRVQQQQSLSSVVSSYDYDTVDAAFKVVADDMTNSLFEFYAKIPKSKLSKYPVLKRKIENFKNTLSDIYTMNRNYKEICKEIMATIKGGMIDDKMINAITKLQTQYLESLKAQENYIMYVEDMAKRAGVEYSEQEEAAKKDAGDCVNEFGEEDKVVPMVKPKFLEKENYITADQKTLMTTCKENNTQTIEGVIEQRSDRYKAITNSDLLVNPMTKNELVKNYDIDTTLVKSNKDEDENNYKSSVLDMM